MTNQLEVWDSLHKQMPSVKRGESVIGEFKSNYFIKLISIDTNCTCVTANLNGTTLAFVINTKNRRPLEGQILARSYTATMIVTYEVKGVRQTDRLQVSFEYKP